MNCATTVGTRIILDIMITSFVVHFGWSGLSPKNPASGNIFYFFFSKWLWESLSFLLFEEVIP